MLGLSGDGLIARFVLAVFERLVTGLRFQVRCGLDGLIPWVVLLGSLYAGICWL